MGGDCKTLCVFYSRKLNHPSSLEQMCLNKMVFEALREAYAISKVALDCKRAEWEQQCWTLKLKISVLMWYPKHEEVALILYTLSIEFSFFCGQAFAKILGAYDICVFTDNTLFPNISGSWTQLFWTPYSCWLVSEANRCKWDEGRTLYLDG